MCAVQYLGTALRPMPTSPNVLQCVYAHRIVVTLLCLALDVLVTQVSLIDINQIVCS